MLHFINAIQIALLLALITSSCRAEEASKDGGLQDLLKNSMKAYFDRMDTDGDGTLSKDEVLTGFLLDWEDTVWAKVCTDDGRYLDELKSDQFIGDLEKSIGEDIDYEDIDTNGDTEISKEEARKISEINLERTVFEKGDLNKNGVFEYKEFLQQIMTFNAENPPDISFDTSGTAAGKNPILNVKLNATTEEETPTMDNDDEDDNDEEEDEDEDEEDEDEDDEDDDGIFVDGRSEEDDDQTTTGDEL